MSDRVFQLNGKNYVGKIHQHDPLQTIINVHVQDYDILDNFGMIVPELNGQKLLKFIRYGDKLELRFSTFPYDSLTAGNCNALSYRLKGNISKGSIYASFDILAGIYFEQAVILQIDDTYVNGIQKFLSLHDTDLLCTVGKYQSIAIGNGFLNEYVSNTHLLLLQLPVKEKVNWKVQGF